LREEVKKRFTAKYAKGAKEKPKPKPKIKTFHRRVRRGAQGTQEETRAGCVALLEITVDCKHLKRHPSETARIYQSPTISAPQTATTFFLFFLRLLRALRSLR